MREADVGRVGTRRWRTAPVAIVSILAGVVALPGALAGQGTGEVQGRVVAAASGAPISGAVVLIDDLEAVATTGEGGGYVLPSLPSGERQIRVEAPGYAGVTTTVPVRPGEVTGVTFRLEAFGGLLEELLVTGDRRRQRGQTAARIDSLDVEERLPADGGAAEVISGGTAGAQILQGGSQPGAGFRLLLRGVNSVEGENDPVIYVDGVRLTSGQAGALLAGVSNRGSLDFLDPSEIARVEVMSGPTASAQYGMNASGGVILIWTKRGGDTEPR